MTQAAAAHAPSRPASFDHAGQSRLVTVATFMAVFLSSYTIWRPIPSMLFTVSDAFFCLAAMLLFASGKQSMAPFADFTPLWFGALGVMMIGLLLGSAVNGDMGRWLIVAAQYCFAYGLLPIALGWRDRATVLRAALALVAGVVAMELYGIVVYIWTGADYERAQAFGFDFITGAHRLGGLMADANWNGAISAMAMPFVMFLYTVRRLGSFTALCAFLVLGGGVVLSGSFTGFSSAAVAVPLFAMVGGTARLIRMLLIVTAGASLAIGSGIALPTAFQHRVAGALENGDLSEAGTYTGRMQLIQEAWQMVDRTPIIGIGVDQFRVVSVDEAPVHNMYLLVWAEGGVLALIGWLVIAVTPIIASIRCYRRDRQAAGLGLAVTSVFLIFSVAAPHMYSRSWVTPLLIAMAMIFARKEEAPAEA